MSESHVTQCPHCRTSFRVSQAQLAAAHGVVRCGACLHVFNAAEQLFGPATTSAAVKAPSAAAQQFHAGTSSKPAAKKAIDDTLWIHDDLDLDSLDLDEELARLEEQEQQLSQQFLALERAPRPAERFEDSGVDDPKDIHDESWTEALLRDEPVKPERARFELQETDALPPAAAAADAGAQLFEPGSVTILSRQFIEVVGGVLRQQAGCRQQVEQAPAEHAPPGGALWLLPVELQGFVVQVEQALFAQTRLVARELGLFAFAVRGFVRLRLLQRFVIEAAKARFVGLF